MEGYLMYMRHHSLWRQATKPFAKQSRSLILMVTETRNEKAEWSGCIITQCFLFLIFFPDQALSPLSRVSPICYLMAASPLVRFPICGQAVPPPRSAEQENNVNSLAQILGDGSCSRATKNELLLSQVWTFALQPAFDEPFLWISRLIFIAGQSARGLWLRPFFVLYTGVILIYVVASYFHLDISASALFSKPRNTDNGF